MTQITLFCSLCLQTTGVISEQSQSRCPSSENTFCLLWTKDTQFDSSSLRHQMRVMMMMKAPMMMMMHIFLKHSISHKYILEYHYWQALSHTTWVTSMFLTLDCMVCDADLSPQDLSWLQYSNTHTHGLQRSCGGKGTARPLSQEKSASECLCHSLKRGAYWPLPWQVFIGFPGPLHQRQSSFTMQRFVWGGYLCRHRRGFCWIHQRRTFAM